MNRKPGMYPDRSVAAAFMGGGLGFLMFALVVCVMIYDHSTRPEKPMPKVTISVGGGHAYFYCPGCEMTHHYQIKAPPNDPKRDTWTFDGNMESPTFTPSLHWIEDGKTRCHLYVKGGRIEYLPDCAHELAGQTVDMVDEGAP